MALQDLATALGGVVGTALSPEPEFQPSELVTPELRREFVEVCVPACARARVCVCLYVPTMKTLATIELIKKQGAHGFPSQVRQGALVSKIRPVRTARDTLMGDIAMMQNGRHTITSVHGYLRQGNAPQNIWQGKRAG